MERFINWLVSASHHADRGIYNVLTHLGLWFIPVAPAVVFGYSFYASVVSSVSPNMALVAGIAAALALEIPGVTSAHTALGLQAAKAESWKVWACWGLVAAYVLLGIGGVVGFEMAGGFAVVGILVFLLMPVAYISLGFSRDLNRLIEQQKAEDKKAESEAEQARLSAEQAQAKRDEVDRENREFERRRTMDEDRRRHEREMKQDELATEAKIKTEQQRTKAQIEVERQRTKAEEERTKRKLAELETEKTERKPNVAETSGEQPPEYTERLAVVRDKSGGDPFGPTDVQDWTGLSKTAAYDFLNYAKITADIHQTGRGKYEANGNGNH